MRVLDLDNILLRDALRDAHEGASLCCKKEAGLQKQSTILSPCVSVLVQCEDEASTASSRNTPEILWLVVCFRAAGISGCRSLPATVCCLCFNRIGSSHESKIGSIVGSIVGEEKNVYRYPTRAPCFYRGGGVFLLLPLRC